MARKVHWEDGIMHCYHNLKFMNVRALYTLAFLFLLLLCPAPAHATVPQILHELEAHDTQLELLSPSEVDAVLNRMVTISLRVTNDALEALTFEITADVPQGWSYTAMPEILEVAAGEAEVVFVSVNMPPGGDPGEYEIVLSAFPSGLPSGAASVGVLVRVLATMLLDVRADRSYQPAAYSGDEIEQTFTVTNIGNASITVEIETESRQDWLTVIDPPDRRLTLDPHQSGIVTVTTSIPEDLTQSVRYRLSVIASPLEPGAEDLEWRAGTSTRVIPSQLTGGPMYATLDSDIRTLISWRDDGEIASRIRLGSLELDVSEGRTARLSGVSLQVSGGSTGRFGQNVRPRARFEDEEMGYVQAGEISTRLESRIVGGGRSGLGGEVLYRSGNGEYRVFYTRGRGSIPAEMAGLEVGYAIGETGIVRLTALRDSELSVPETYEREPETSTIVGLLAGWQPWEGTELTGEVGRSGSDGAWRLNGRYKAGSFSTNCEWLRAGTDFRGGWQDTEIRRLNLSWSPFTGVNIFGNYNQSLNNLDYDPEEEGRRNKNMAFGATWNIEDVGRLRVSHRIDRSRDVILEEYNRISRMTEYSFSRSWGTFAVTASWQDQTEEDLLTGDVETENTLRFDCTTRLNSDISLKFGYATGRTSGNNGVEAARTTDLSLGGDVRLSRELDLSLSIQRSSGGFGGSRTSINGSFNWEMPSGCTLNLRARSYTGTFGGDTEIALGFTYPLSIPMTMFPRKGSAEGRLFQSDDPTLGIPNVEISVGGMTMVTDDSGFFRFPSLDPGEHQLTLDTPSLGVGLTPEVELPLIFIVEAGATVELEIPVMRSVAVGGQVFIETPGGRGEMPSRRPISGMVIELQSVDGSSYRYSDSFGRFLYTDLAPGNYVVLVRSEWLPQWHEVRDPVSISFELASGESRRDLEFTVVPVVREIEITTEF